MSSISIDVSSTIDNVKWHIDLDRRFTVIRGDSGIGKSTFVQLVENPPFGVTVQCELPIIVANDMSYKSILTASENSIIILDDCDSVGSTAFADTVKKTADNGNYIVIIGRDHIDCENKDKGYKRLSYSTKSILEFKVSEDGRNHYTQQVYTSKKKDEEMKIECILLEDKSKALKLFLEIYKNSNVKVMTATNGKSSFCNDAEVLLKKYNTLCLFDSAAFGCHIDEFVDRFKYNENVVLDRNYECFECFLANSAYLKNKFKTIDLSKEANKYMSWETFYEEFVTDVTQGTVLQYSHKGKNIRDCWYKNCEDCDEHRKVKCIKYIAGNKIQYLLDTDWLREYLKILDLGGN